MTDTELIKDVLKKLGWKHNPKFSPNGDILPWIGPDTFRRSELPPWLTSVDAALGVLGKRSYDIFSRETGYQFWLWPDTETATVLGEDESLPRAILLAFLELPKENL